MGLARSLLDSPLPLGWNCGPLRIAISPGL